MQLAEGDVWNSISEAAARAGETIKSTALKAGDTIKDLSSGTSSSGRPSRSRSGGGGGSSAGADGDDFFGTFGVDSGTAAGSSSASSQMNSDNESWDQDNFGKKVRL